MVFISSAISNISFQRPGSCVCCLHPISYCAPGLYPDLNGTIYPRWPACVHKIPSDHYNNRIPHTAALLDKLLVATAYNSSLTDISDLLTVLVNLILHPIYVTKQAVREISYYHPSLVIVFVW